MADGINVNFSATDAGFSGTVAKVNASMKNMDDNTRKVSGSIKSSFGSMVKAGAGLAAGFVGINAAFAAVRGTLDNFGEALDMGGRLNDLSTRTSETAGNLLLLERAFTNAGSSAEKVGPTINKLQKSIIDAGSGSGPAVDAFKRLGLNLEELKYAAPIDSMQAVGEALAGVTNPAERATLAMDIFGKSGGELLPMLLDMQAGVKGAASELGSLPDIMNRNAAAFDAISDKLAVTKGKLTEFTAGVLESALPALNSFAEGGARLDAADFGRKLGSDLAEAFAILSSGEGWDAFLINFHKTRATIQSAPMVNSFNAQIENLKAQLSGDAPIFNGQKNIDRLKQSQLQANIELIDSYDDGISAIMERNTQRMSDSAARLDAEAAARRAESGIMVGDIRTTPPEFKQGLELLAMKGASAVVKENLEKAAAAITTAAKEVKEQLSHSDEIQSRITQSLQKNKIDPGGKLEARANEAAAAGDAGAARRAEMGIRKNEENQRIQDAFGNGRAAHKSLQDIAKDQGVDTMGKKASDLRRELDRMAKDGKKRQDELAPGQGGKERPAEEKPADKADAAATRLESLVEKIATLVQKIEPKLPTHALGT